MAYQDNETADEVESGTSKDRELIGELFCRIDQQSSSYLENICDRLPLIKHEHFSLIYFIFKCIDIKKNGD